MQQVLPVTIIGGYLGSGKTTLVNHLLHHANGVRLAVLVNDFGELAIDADLIEAQDGDVISLSGGCVCCSYGDDLTLSLQKLQAQAVLPDHIVIEASGVALPGAIGRSLSLNRAYQLESIVVLADATTIQSSANEKYIGDTIQRQLSDADLIVLNKVDLLSKSQAQAVRGWVGEHHDQAPVVDAIFSTIDPRVIFEAKPSADLLAEPASSGANHRLSRDGDHAHASGDAHNASVFTSISLNIEQAVDADVLASQLADKHCGLVRAKGFVRHHDATMKTIQVVGRRWSVTNAPAGVQTGVVCIACSDELSEASIRTMCHLDAPVAV